MMVRMIAASWPRGFRTANERRLMFTRSTISPPRTGSLSFVLSQMQPTAFFTLCCPFSFRLSVFTRVVLQLNKSFQSFYCRSIAPPPPELDVGFQPLTNLTIPWDSMDNGELFPPTTAKQPMRLLYHDRIPRRTRPSHAFVCLPSHTFAY